MSRSTSMHNLASVAPKIAKLCHFLEFPEFDNFLGNPYFFVFGTFPYQNSSLDGSIGRVPKLPEHIYSALPTVKQKNLKPGLHLIV